MSDPLLALLAHPSPEIERAALLLAQSMRPETPVAATLAELDAMAASAAPMIEAAGSAREKAVALVGHFAVALRFRGNDDDYHDPRNSYLDEVVRRRTGIPISLAVVFIALARRVGIDAEGIGFPGHFLCRVDDAIVDLFHGGRFLERKDLEALAGRYLGDAAHLRNDHVAPASVHAIVIRMLTNLKNAYQRRGDFSHALLAADRLVDVTGSPEARRDRGLLAMKLGSIAGAVDDLSAYLAARPAARDRAMVADILERAKITARTKLQ